MQSNQKNTQLVEAMKTIADVGESIKKQMRETHEMILQAIQPSIESLGEIGRTFKETNNLINEHMAKTFENLRNGLLETEEDLKVFKVAMVEMGYPPHSAIEISRMRSIAQQYENNKIEVVSFIDEFMVMNYDSELIGEIAHGWERVEIIKKRLPLLRNACMAHNLGMYDLVVPSMLSQLEGIIVDAFDINGKVDGKIQGILLEHLLLKNSDIQSSFHFDDAIHKYYSEQVLEGFEHGQKTKYDVSRHGILHGAETNFGKETTSIKTILLFDFLVDAIQELNPSTIVSAKKEIANYRKGKKSKYKRNKR
jgi:hypothetical protein